MASERRHWLLPLLLATSVPAWPAATKAWETAIPDSSEDAFVILDATGNPSVVTKNASGRLRFAALDRAGAILSLGDFPTLPDAQSRVPAAAVAAPGGGAISCGRVSTFAPFPALPAVDGLIVKFSASGAAQWSRVLDEAELGLCGLRSVSGCTATSGSLYVAGAASPLPPFPGAPPTCPFISDNFKSFIIRLDATNGAVTALRTFPIASGGTTYGAMASSGAAVYALGARGSSMVLDRYDADLNLIWTATAATTGLSPVSVAVSSRGEVAALGQRGTLDARVIRFSTGGSQSGEAVVAFPETSGVALTDDSFAYVSGRRSPGQAALAGVTPADVVTVEFEDPAVRGYLSVATDGGNDIFTTGETFGDVLATRFNRQGAAPDVLSVVLQPPSVAPGAATQVQVTLTDASGNPVADKDITFTAEPIPTSGGHDHGGSRPVGVFSGVGGIVSSFVHGRTGIDGRLTAIYTTAEFGGEETIRSYITATPSVRASASLEIRERDPAGRVFVPLAASPGVYLKDGGTVNHHGPGCTQASGCDTPDRNHFGRLEMIQALVAVATEWQTTNPRLEINDISLSHGGAFDICGTWNVADVCPDAPAPDGGHKAHRLGRGVDFQISPGLSPRSLPLRQREQLRALIERHGSGRKNVRFREYRGIRSHWHVDFMAF